MTRITAATAALLLTGGALTGTALSAGGLDRSGQPIGALFEEGNFAELGFGLVQPEVSGIVGGVLGSGNMVQDYTQFTFSLKMDVNDRLSFALILDQPYGANIAYDDTDPGYPLAGTTADLRSGALTALARYRINDRFSIHGGLRAVSMEADLTVVSPAGTYDAQFESDTALGYVVGAAYEIPDIALRVALTYSSATEFSNVTHVTGVPDAMVPNTEFSMPQSVSLDFQSGIAADTLLFGQIRWVDWTETDISPAFYPGNPLVSYEKDRITYTVGVGRRFSDAFSGAISVSYEEDQDLFVSNLSPTDGQLSVQVGGTYTVNNIELTGGVRYIRLGDAITDSIGADFADNDVIALGLSVGYRF